MELRMLAAWAIALLMLLVTSVTSIAGVPLPLGIPYVVPEVIAVAITTFLVGRLKGFKASHLAAGASVILAAALVDPLLWRWQGIAKIEESAVVLGASAILNGALGILALGAYLVGARCHRKNSDPR